ncbi:MAG: LCP family protein [Cellulomonas sp.]|nr:LCP family protein [Cellulomonas sp.]
MRRRAPVLPAPGRKRRAVAIIAGAAVLLIGGVAAFASYKYNDLSNGIRRSAISLPGVPDNTVDSNILVMGLDSRLDENGNPLPADVYDALNAGNQSDGGYNTNVLMLIHIPANNGKAVGISIPRDDYVALAGNPDGVSMSKIKEAYGLALDQKLRELTSTGRISHQDAYQQARTAARQTEIATVSNFLGGVTINHFIEVTMAAFYQVAQAVQPITVCLNEATADTYSGANFPAGVQQLSAAQAVSFVRQRRDTANPGLDFTDLDREVRQQAFIISLAFKIRQTDTFTNLGTLQSLIATAKQNIAMDSKLNLLSFAGQASRLAGGKLTFTTLPITAFGVRQGKDVNIVDLNQIHTLTAQLLSSTPTQPATTATSSPSPTSASRSTTSTKTRTSPSPAPAPNLYANPPVPLASGSIPCVK